MKEEKAFTLDKKRGVITFMNFEKSYGMVMCPPEEIEYFFHASDVREEPGGEEEVDEFEKLNTGNIVEFRPVYAKKGWKALGLVKVEE